MSDLLATQSASALSRGTARLQSDDAVVVTVQVGAAGSMRLAYLRSLVPPSAIEDHLLSPLAARPARIAALAGSRRLQGAVQVTSSLLAGRVVVEHGTALYSVTVPVAKGRPVEQPSTERAVFAAKDAFVETLDQNLALIRQHAPDPDLRVELVRVGTDVPTRVAVLSIADMGDPALHATVVNRLNAHPVRRLAFVSHLVSPLFGPVWSPFLPVSFTERPDQVSEQLYRGRVAVLADGSPFALMMPKTWIDEQREEEDHLLSPITRAFIRTLRLIAAFSATALPGLYIAILGGNTNFLPGLLSIAVASSRESVPYPLLTETLFIMVVFDILAESTVAMKGVLGPSISIVGSLIIGEAAVRANLVSNLSVMLVAATALGTFVTPHFWITYGYRIWKYPIIVASAMLGLVGWTASVSWLIVHLASTRTLGVSYATAFGSAAGQGAAEVIQVHPRRSTLPDPTGRS